MTKSAFKLKSGNSPLFKQMGSSPVKHDKGASGEKGLPDHLAGEFHTDIRDGHHHASASDGNVIERKSPGKKASPVKDRLDRLQRRAAKAEEGAEEAGGWRRRYRRRRRAKRLREKEKELYTQRLIDQGYEGEELAEKLAYEYDPEGRRLPTSRHKSKRSERLRQQHDMPGWEEAYDKDYTDVYQGGFGEYIPRS